MAGSDVKLVVDCRERALASDLRKLGVEFDVEGLPVGDVIAELGGGRRRILFERKSMYDLSASIKDGRLVEQKARLMDAACGERRNVVYIVESSSCGLPGSQSRRLRGITLAALEVTIANIMVRDGVCVVRTKNVRATAGFLADLVKRATACPDDYCRTDAPPIAPIIAKKRDAALRDATSDALLVAQIANVPGISGPMARRVLASAAPKARCVADLVWALRAKGAAALRVKGVGPKLGDRIWAAVMGASCSVDAAEVATQTDDVEMRENFGT
jgi:ERCC4-type nuclease